MLWEQVWDRICSLQGQRFVTKTGKPFTYLLESGTTVWIERDGKRINQSLVKSNFSQVFSMLQSKPIAGPTEINERAIENGESQVRGPSYVWAILHDKRVIL